VRVAFPPAQRRGSTHRVVTAAALVAFIPVGHDLAAAAAVGVVACCSSR
jgi:hypothetical protein